MAGIITISPGHDASYPWRQIGASAEPARAGRAGASYYLSPAEKGGEPPGLWRGAGVADLGFSEGQVIEREVFERLYGKFIDPRDPAGVTRLGRAPQRFRSAEEIFAVLVALEPEATAERRTELMIEAKSQVRTPVLYFDATFSVSKSITLLHASAMANAATAASAGDLAAVAYWEQAAADVWACVQAGNRAALEYLQREAGYTRSGYHGRQAGGVRTGRWEDAHGFIVGSFAQHTSRDGDPQLHIHNLILNRVMRERDGAYRTLDSQALHEHRGAAAAIATVVMESALSREFGAGWVSRADGHGREVKGVNRELMEEFSSRRQTIGALTERLAAQFEAQHGRAPDARALSKLRLWANHASRRAKEGAPLDVAAEARRWAKQARTSEAGALEPVMPAVTTRRGPGEPGVAEPRPIWELTPEQERDLMAQALARVQQAQPTWRGADLMRHLGELLPDDVACRDDAAAVALLADLARRVLSGGAGEGEEILALEVPEWPRVPDALRRADGRSVYRPHSGTRYATQAQLTMEERLIAQAQQPGSPRLAPAVAARLLGADLAQLEAQLGAGAQSGDAAQQETGSGLRLDQAAAAFLAVTSDRRAEILVGPAGSGKTRTAAVVARLWRGAGMGQVYGLTTSQAARNVLRDAGVDLADNTAVFLGHLQGRREARRPKTVKPGTLLLLDEASMMSMADMAAIMRLAAQRRCRVLITGDHEQLAAVEGGGGMMMLARQMGFVQLAEPVRFAQEWERDATLRLRSGDVPVLAQYEEQGRLRGGDPEEAMEQACRAFVADHLAGKDSLLLARTGEQAREMSRRVRDDLKHYGIVRPGAEVVLRHNAIASRGDLIVARKNDRSIMAGVPGRGLTNRDVLRVEAAAGQTVTVRRLTERDPGSGKPIWSALFQAPKTYLFSHCDLAYATTPHAVQGRTVDTTHVLVDGMGDRQGLYVGMSRGREANYAYCVTGFPRAADVRAGSRPAAELERARTLIRERAGLGPEPAARGPDGGGPEAAVPHRDPVAVLAEVLQRDGAVLSATETLRSELSAADHLGVLGSIWYDQVRNAQVTRFERSLRGVLPASGADTALRDPACTWLWRSLREAEMAGLDAGEVLRAAVAARPLAGSRDVVRVIDSRVRHVLEQTVPQPRPTWSQCVPEMGDPDLDRFMTELAAAMDDRVRRIGEHVARTSPLWATQALGDVPENPAARAEWEDRASKIGAYRELYGYDAQADAIGPQPGKTSPEARADWHAAFAALGRVEGIDLRAFSDDELRLHRGTYERETSWAPPHVAEELRLARLQARTAFENATREEHEARAATDPEAAGRHEQLAGMWQAMHAKATSVADMLAETQETRRQWDALTEPTRRVALAADLELRRRHTGQLIEPLKSAEPEGITLPGPARPPRREVWVQQTLDGSCHLPGTSPEDSACKEPALTPAQREVFGQEALGLTPETSREGIPEQVLRIRENARTAQAKLDELRDMHVPDEDQEAADLGPAWNILASRDRDAILQPPKPDVTPSSEILRRAQERGVDREPELG
ncbi:MAG TPA: MobF family relaxase [Streptosporangiaceae bacterium]|nr:MobF family relaxase [Streptosporangiaceae bacterium]